ncbi:MAG TPA: hypothetical protein VHF47_12695 [Acidimicrobiales bacterium]|nr:hypothetical protein [Acidimicrobiales bacterium]
MRRLARAAAALLLLAACRVETTVAVDADADGSGRVQVEVALDREAARRVPDLAGQLRVDDLRAAGWEVERPQRADGGGLTVRLAKPYRTPAEAVEAIEELSGSNGPFRDFRLRRDRSFLRTTTAISGTVDLRGGLEAFGDEALREQLGGSLLGFDPAELEGQLGTPLSRVFAFRVVARLPGDVSSNAPSTADGDAVWRPLLGERVVLTAKAERWNVRNIAAATVSVAAAVGLGVVLVRRRSEPSR